MRQPQKDLGVDGSLRDDPAIATKDDLNPWNPIWHYCWILLPVILIQQCCRTIRTNCDRKEGCRSLFPIESLAPAIDLLRLQAVPLGRRHDVPTCRGLFDD